MPTRAVWQTKRLLDAAERATFEEQLELEAVDAGRADADARLPEGVAAFLEKREPAFTGADVERPHPIRCVIDDDRRRWRLTVAAPAPARHPAPLPLDFWALLALVVAIVNWFIALVARPHAAGRARVARALRSVLDPRVRLRLLLADPYPRSAAGRARIRSISSRPARDPVALEDRVPPRCSSFRRSSSRRARRRLARRRAARLVRLPRARPHSVRIPRPRRLLPSLPGADVRVPRFLLTDRYPTLASGSGFQFERGEHDRHRINAAPRHHPIGLIVDDDLQPQPADRLLPAAACDPAFIWLYFCGIVACIAV